MLLNQYDKEFEVVNKNKHVIVISVDAMIESDIGKFAKRKNMKCLLADSAMVRKVHCIYPTYTYPCHATIMTGCYPDKHGIYHNEIFNPYGDRSAWFWFADSIKRPTIIDVAKKYGLTTSTVAFPVQGGNNADYSIAEIWEDDKDKDPSNLFKRANSAKVGHIFEKNKHLLNWQKTPEYDYFASACAMDIIKEFKPNLMFIHFSYLDHQRHNLGASTDKVLHAIDFIDDRVGEIIKAVSDSGYIDNTDFIILGDHGHIDVKSIFNINKLLLDKGLFALDEHGNVKSWRMFAHSVSFSAQIYLNNINVSAAERILDEIREEYPLYIERVLNKFEAKEIYHLAGPFEFVVEPQTHVVIGQGFDCALVEEPKQGGLSSHGFSPEKGPNPPFIIFGRDANNGIVIENAKLVDEAPTILSLFNLEMPDGIDGKPIADLIRK